LKFKSFGFDAASDTSPMAPELINDKPIV